MRLPECDINQKQWKAYNAKKQVMDVKVDYSDKHTIRWMYYWKNCSLVVLTINGS